MYILRVKSPELFVHHDGFIQTDAIEKQYLIIATGNKENAPTPSGSSFPPLFPATFQLLLFGYVTNLHVYTRTVGAFTGKLLPMSKFLRLHAVPTSLRVITRYSLIILPISGTCYDFKCSSTLKEGNTWEELGRNHFQVTCSRCENPAVSHHRCSLMYGIGE